MRILLQRVSRALVRVEDEVIGEIGRGLLLFVGFRIGDDETTVKYLAEKVSNLRIFEDNSGKMNSSLIDKGLACLVVSQFTLYGDTSKGNRPSFTLAERPELAEGLYRKFIDGLRARIGSERVAEGRFRAMMEVELVNDGPVTLLLEKCHTRPLRYTRTPSESHTKDAKNLVLEYAPRARGCCIFRRL